jgi:hypothetical protein
MSVPGASRKIRQGAGPRVAFRTLAETSRGAAPAPRSLVTDTEATRESGGFRISFRSHYDPSSHEICAIRRERTGYGKVAVLEELETELWISPDRTVYVVTVSRTESFSILARAPKR